MGGERGGETSHKMGFFFFLYFNQSWMSLVDLSKIVDSEVCCCVTAS